MPFITDWLETPGVVRMGLMACGGLASHAMGGGIGD